MTCSRLTGLVRRVIALTLALKAATFLALDAKVPFATVGLRNRNTTNRPRLVILGPQFGHESSQFLRQPRLEVGDRLTVHARSSLSASDFLEGTSKSSAIPDDDYVPNHSLPLFMNRTSHLFACSS